VDLAPAPERGLGAFPLLERGGFRPAGGVRGDLLRRSLSREMPQVPAVAALNCAGKRRLHGLAAGPRAVSAHDLDAGVRLQPVLDDAGGAALQDVGPAAGPGVDQDRRAGMTLPQGEITDAGHTGNARAGKADRHQRAQRRVPGDIDAQRACEVIAGGAGKGAPHNGQRAATSVAATASAAATRT
jgi:hypothetical protein